MEGQLTKDGRQKLILELISRRPVETQQQLQELLEKSGVRCTRIGRIVPGSGAVRTTGALNWS